MFGKYLNTQHGRLPVKTIRSFAMYNNHPGRYWTIIIAQLHEGPFRVFSLPGSMDAIRSFIGIGREVAFHEIILRDPNTSFRPLLKSLAEKLRVGKDPTDLEVHALGDGILGEGVDHDAKEEDYVVDETRYYGED